MEVYHTIYVNGNTFCFCCETWIQWIELNVLGPSVPYLMIKLQLWSYVHMESSYASINCLLKWSVADH